MFTHKRYLKFLHFKGSPYGAKCLSLIFIYKQVAPTGHQSLCFTYAHFYILHSKFYILHFPPP